MDDNIYPLEFLYDGDCPICRADVARLHNADGHQRLIFIDVSAPNFDPGVYDRTREALLARIHARRADGIMVEGPEVFRLALAAVGLGPIAALTRWPLISQVTDIAYKLFARHRVSLSRHFGGFFARITPECDLFCRPPLDKEKPSTRNY